MRKTLIAAAVAAMICGDMLADNHTYTYQYWDSEFEDWYRCTGMLRRVSPNGRWAVGGDEEDNIGGYLIDTEEPELLVFTDGGSLLDVNNEGLAVGTFFTRTGGGAVYKSAGIFANGEWIQLPLPDEIKGTSQAVAISADSKRIAGHALCASEAPDEPGRYFPVTWKLNESTGEYELDRLYNNLYLPGSYGFFVYAMTPDGRYICGQQMLDWSDSIAAMLDTETGELKIWHKIEYRDVTDEYGTMQRMFVDGIQDGFDESAVFGGTILSANNRYLFGRHAVVTELTDPEEGAGTIVNYPAVYDLELGEWTDCDPSLGIFMCGNGPEEAFTSTGDLFSNGTTKSINSIVGGPDRVDAIYGFDRSGKVWAGSQVFQSPWGEILESPVLVMMEKETLGVEGLTENQDKMEISVAESRITVSGIETADIYSVDGALVARGSSASVAPGIYVVTANGRSCKILVK